MYGQYRYVVHVCTHTCTCMYCTLPSVYTTCTMYVHIHCTGIYMYSILHT